MNRGIVPALRVGAVAFIWMALVAASSPNNQGCSLPVVYSVTAAFTGALDPNSPPPGANNLSCQSTTHPYPVVLVHATFANQHDNFNALSPLLYNHGYCVYTFNYGGPPLLGTLYGLNEIAASAQELATFVNTVLAATGKSKVDLVGHSQGGMMPHYYMKFLGGAAKVHTFVGIAPANHGSALADLIQLANYIPGVSTLVNEGLENVCPACLELVPGSAFLTNLASGGITVPGVNYTVISSIYDEVVIPWQSQQLSGSNVTNIVLQDQCAIDFSGHLGIAYDHIALQYVLNALDPAHPATPLCTYIGFETGG
jgi:triacylglycerol esterase/lipase EstA (alpha/beta hydrolase family)